MYNWLSQLTTLYPKHSIAIVVILLVTAASLILHGMLMIGLAIASVGSLISAAVAASCSNTGLAVASATTFVVAILAISIL